MIAKSPAAAAILNAHNIDTCCGGRDSLGEAAKRAHVDPAALIDQLAAATLDAPPVTLTATLPVKSCSCGCR